MPSVEVVGEGDECVGMILENRTDVGSGRERERGRRREIRKEKRRRYVGRMAKIKEVEEERGKMSIR